MSLENKNFQTNNKKKSGSQYLPLEFFKTPKMQMLELSENLKITKIRKSGQNWHFYLSIKQIITLENRLNSFSRKIPKIQLYNFRFLAKVVIF